MIDYLGWLLFGAAALWLWRVIDAQRWRPIETAPKDGTMLLVCEPGCGYALCYYKWRERGCEGLWADPGGGYMHPTHWRPLPEWPRSVLASQAKSEQAYRQRVNAARSRVVDQRKGGGRG